MLTLLAWWLIVGNHHWDSLFNIGSLPSWIVFKNRQTVFTTFYNSFPYYIDSLYGLNKTFKRSRNLAVLEEANSNLSSGIFG
jgi:hypothetical protein